MLPDYGRGFGCLPCAPTRARLELRGAGLRRLDPLSSFAAPLTQPTRRAQVLTMLARLAQALSRARERAVPLAA